MFFCVCHTRGKDLGGRWMGRATLHCNRRGVDYVSNHGGGGGGGGDGVGDSDGDGDGAEI